MNILKTFALILLLLPFFVSAQNEGNGDASDIIESIIEQLSENSEKELDFSELSEDLLHFAENPINLNNTTKEELERLSFLSDLQIENLLYYIYRHSPMETLYELQLVEGLDSETIKNLLPFVYIGKKEEQKTAYSLKDLLKRGKNNLYLRMNGTFERKAGYDNDKYLGEPFYASVRYLFQSSNRLYFGVVSEKDESEPFWTKKHKGFDFYSVHFQLKNTGRFKNIVLGDYKASFGLGLVLSNEFLTGKSSYVLNVIPHTTGLRKSSSMDEYNFLRGGGATVQFGKFDFTAFYSYRKLDAGVEGDSLSSFKTDGLHRTEVDWEKRHNIAQQILGGNVTYSDSFFKTGITAVQTCFDTTVMPDEKPYNLYYFRGRELFNIGWNYEFTVHRFHFAGETATDSRWNIATLNSVMFNPVSNVGIALLHRDYSERYQSFFANSFAEGSAVRNERGLYIGTEIQPIKQWKLSAYADTYHFPWLRYTTARPSDGYDVLAQLDFAASSRLNMYLRYRYKEYDKNYSVSDYPSAWVDYYAKSSLRYVLNYSFSRTLSFRNTVEFNWVDRAVGDNTQGFMMSQDFSYTFPRTPLKADVRFVVFDIPNYDNRVYSYEKDVLYAYSIPAYYGVGSRAYLNLKYTVSKHLAVWFKIAQTLYADRDIISSGNELISANHKTDWRVLVNYKF